MPRVKIDYVVSFSSEDPENQANNLLSWEVSKKRWLCRAGEPSCSVVLQLTRAVKISSLQIGVHHAALVEVLVGRSETPNEPYQVLVPRSVFVSPHSSRGPAVGRVRSLAGAALQAGAAAQRWDRLRLVCAQPYNKHCSYGISFIHVFEPDSEAPAPAPALAPAQAPAPAPALAPAQAPAPAPALPPRMFPLDTFSSDEEEFRPGELFAKHRQSGGNTGAQIRQATSQALKNNSEAAAKLVKTTISRHKPAPAPAPSPEGPRSPRDGARDKDDLLYTKDEEQPHAKIDHIVQRHKDEAKTPKPKEKVKETDKDKTLHSKKPSTSSSKHSENNIDRERKKEQENSGRDVNGKQADKRGASCSRNKDESRKRPHSDTNQAEDECEAVGPSCARPLAGVVLVLSGYQNPRRARLRDLAASLGARARRDWGPGCTHLICAFSSTPKLSAVRAAPGGSGVPAPRAEWLEQCARRGRRLPWRWFAAEPARRLPPAPTDSECDTDDEIEAVLRQTKKARGSLTAAGAPSAPPAPDDVELAKDERTQGSVPLADSDSADTDVEQAGGGGRGGGGGGGLPALLAGRRLAVRGAAPLDAGLLARYCRAYGGLVVEPQESEDFDDDTLVLCGRRGARGGERGGARGGVRVRADWLWACHAAAALLPLQEYLIT